MNSNSHWLLRQSRCNCKVPIAVPTPTRTTILGDPQGMPKAATQAAFLCTACGLVTLYSDKDLDFEQRSTVCPFLEKRYDLVYIEVGCVGSNCESLTPIHVVFDVGKGNFATAKPMNEWVFDKDVKCEHDHRVLLDPSDTYPIYHAEMPF